MLYCEVRSRYGVRETDACRSFVSRPPAFVHVGTHQKNDTGDYRLMLRDGRYSVYVYFYGICPGRCCCTGKYLGCDAAGGFLLGSDASVNLLHVCRERLPEVNKTHALQQPSGMQRVRGIIFGHVFVL